MIKQVTVTDLQRRAAEVISGLREGPVVISQRGRPAAVIITAEAYEQMEQAVAEVEAKQVREIVREVVLPRKARVFYLFVPDFDEVIILGLLPRGKVFRSRVLGPRFEEG